MLIVQKLTSLDSFAVSNIGKVRKNNEDNLIINRTTMTKSKVDQCVDCLNVCIDGGTVLADGIPFWGVFDGMGGESFGELASLTAAEHFSELDVNNGDIKTLILDAIDTVNAKIVRKAEENKCARIGSTMALAYIKKGMLCAINIGDSRIYLIRKSKIRQLTYDHTEAQYLIDSKILTQKSARTHRSRHILAQHLGMTDFPLEPYVAKPVRLRSGDRILLCSDGVTEMLDDTMIKELVLAASDAASAAKMIVDSAVDGGGVDNTTAIVVFAN